MVNFKNNNITKENENIQKQNLETEFTFRVYTHLVNTPDALKIAKENDIKFFKKKGYNVYDSETIDKIDIIPAFKIMLTMRKNIEQGLALCFISECYEPFRIFDSEEEQEKFATKQKESKISDYDIKDFLVERGYTKLRHFMDFHGHIQTSDLHGKIAARDKNGEVRKTIGKGNKTSVEKMDIPLEMFSLKSLNFALDSLIKQNKTEEKAIKKNQANSLNKVELN